MPVDHAQTNVIYKFQPFDKNCISYLEYFMIIITKLPNDLYKTGINRLFKSNKRSWNDVDTQLAINNVFLKLFWWIFFLVVVVVVLKFNSSTLKKYKCFTKRFLLPDIFWKLIKFHDFNFKLDLLVFETNWLTVSKYEIQLWVLSVQMTYN